MGIGVIVAASTLANDAGTALAVLLLTANAVWRTLRPLDASHRRAGNVFLLLDLAITFAAVCASGRWSSPFIFALIIPVFLVGFGRGYVQGFVIASLAVVATTAVHAAGAPLADARHDITSAVLVLELTALLAGYARHVFVEAQEQHEDAVDRMAQLTEANALLLALHQVAQTLPSSLDLDETLAASRSRLRELFNFTSLTVFVAEPTGGGWSAGASDGVRLPSRLPESKLPDPVRAALARREPVVEVDLLAAGLAGMSPRGRSGLYVPLTARGRLVAVLAMEHIEADRFHQRELDLARGVLEPLALAIDNALWFRRLRSLGAEEERVRIARELHDRTAQSLAYVSFELDRLSDRHADDADMRQLRDEVRTIVGEVRDTLYELRANVSETADLRATASDYLPRYHARTGVNVSFNSPGHARLPARVEQELWRILQEALRNVEQHAGASRAWVTWDTDGSTARLEVVDDGLGFDRDDSTRADAYGMVGMRERADEIGASLTVDAARGHGTRILVEWEGRS